jgi:hypothetical protein
MCRAVPLLPAHLHGVVLKDRNTSVGVTQDEVGSDPAEDYTLYYGVGKSSLSLSVRNYVLRSDINNRN